MAAATLSRAGQDPRQLLADNIDLIRRIVHGVARRWHLRAVETEDLESAVWSRLVDDNYRAIRQYRGNAKLSTFLTVVISRVLLDLRAAQSGRWRPSNRARRLGGSALVLERLVLRDGYSLEAACDRIAADGGERPSPEMLRALDGGAQWKPRRFVPIEDVQHRLEAADDPAASLVAAERNWCGRRVGRMLKHAMAGLSAHDRLLLRLRHGQGMRVADIARMLGVDQQKLYARFDSLHAKMRRTIEHSGISRNDALDVVGQANAVLPSLIPAVARSGDATTQVA